jgi:glycosyltransferase involved in cell wall biosynthesis
VNVFHGLRIALVGPQPPPAGGMALQTQQLAGLLRAEHAVVLMVATNPPYRPGWVEGWRGVRAVCRLLQYLPALWRVAGQVDLMHVMSNSGWSWHLFTVPAVWVARLRGVPVVINYRGGAAEAFLARAAGAVRLTLARSAGLVVPSGFLVDVFARHRMAAEVVPNIVDLACFKPAPALSAAPRVLVARNLEAIYDIATAVRAFAVVRARLPDASLVLAGSGPEEPALRSLVQALGLQDCVHFAGRLSRAQVADELRRCRVALNPSQVDNMPNAVIEALASGVPVVSTRVGGVPYMVEDGKTALLVPVGDAPAMAQALLRVLEDAALAEQLRAAGQQRAAQWSWASAGPAWAGVYKRALVQGHAQQR